MLSDEEDVVPARGSRPPCLGEPRGPQERDQQRTVEQIAVYAPMVQILDVPVAQMGEQLVDVLQFFDALILVAEQVIEVPKIIIERIPPRTSVREPQLAEQLVEVPTIVFIFLVAAGYGADRGHSSSAGWWATRRSSRFSPRTEFNRCCADL